jgi:hypothetical protein
MSPRGRDVIVSISHVWLEPAPLTATGRNRGPAGFRCLRRGHFGRASVRSSRTSMVAWNRRPDQDILCLQHRAIPATLLRQPRRNCIWTRALPSARAWEWDGLGGPGCSFEVGSTNVRRRRGAPTLRDRAGELAGVLSARRGPTAIAVGLGRGAAGLTLGPVRRRVHRRTELRAVVRSRTRLAWKPPRRQRLGRIRRHHRIGLPSGLPLPRPRCPARRNGAWLVRIRAGFC